MYQFSAWNGLFRRVVSVASLDLHPSENFWARGVSMEMRGKFNSSFSPSSHMRTGTGEVTHLTRPKDHHVRIPFLPPVSLCISLQYIERWILKSRDQDPFCMYMIHMHIKYTRWEYDRMYAQNFLENWNAYTSRDRRSLSLFFDHQLESWESKFANLFWGHQLFLVPLFCARDIRDFIKSRDAK